ncbi:hypothetical protein [Litorimonas sp. WD9-15]|uniref:hypothetical protein n=1 Tax=Litorimonas sp. WD9-15 TaxID=3418716 RepID=UPI003D027107
MKRAILLSGILLALPVAAAAQKPSLNVVQQCQAVLDFTSERVGDVKAYDQADVKTVQKGLDAYNAFLQAEHIKPGLLEFTGGDQTAAKDYQTQIDAFKEQIVTGLKAKHPQARIFTDQAIAINNCYEQAPMDASQTPMMKNALETIIKLARQG